MAPWPSTLRMELYSFALRWGHAPERAGFGQPFVVVACFAQHLLVLLRIHIRNSGCIFHYHIGLVHLIPPVADGRIEKQSQPRKQRKHQNQGHAIAPEPRFPPHWSAFCLAPAQPGGFSCFSHPSVVPFENAGRRTRPAPHASHGNGALRHTRYSCILLLVISSTPAPITSAAPTMYSSVVPMPPVVGSAEPVSFVISAACSRFVWVYVPWSMVIVVSAAVLIASRGLALDQGVGRHRTRPQRCHGCRSGWRSASWRCRWNQPRKPRCC
jgi:hypothetical protein